MADPGCVEAENAGCVSAASHTRRLLRRAYHLEIATVGWNILEGLIAVTAGSAADSVALVGFGVDSFVETTSGLVVGWRFHRQLQGRGAEAGQAERRASRAAGLLLLALAAYIVIEAGLRLLGIAGHARESVLGIVLASVSLIGMPILGRAKLQTARLIGSRALRADAYETIACAWLSLTTLAGLVLNAMFGWWWADPLAALGLVPLIAREGIEAWKNPDEKEEEVN